MLPLSGFDSDLLDGILSVIADGYSRIVFWGVNPACLRVLSLMSSSGLLPHVTAIIDARTTMRGKTLFGFDVQEPRAIREINVDVLVITSDQDKERALEEYLSYDDRLPRIVFSGNANYDFDDPVYFDIVKSCPIKSKAGGYPHMLIHLYQCLKHVATKGLKGDVAEFGVFQGGTTVFMAKVLRYYGHEGKIYGFDTFSGFPTQKSALDLYKDPKCEFSDYSSVSSYCSPYNIELVPGDICTTFTRLKTLPLVLCFFDTDNYSATYSALTTCIDQTVQGGMLAFDHYYSPTWHNTVGERIAIRQVLRNKSLLNLFGTGVFVKI